MDSEVKKVKSSPSAFVASKDPSLDASAASLDNVENDCQLGSDGNLTPNLMNGKGPLDHFIQKNPGGDTSDPGDVPDPPKGSAHGLGDSPERGDVDSGAAVTIGKELSCPIPSQSSPAGDSVQTEEPCAAAAQAEQGSGAAGSQPRLSCKDVGSRKGAQDVLFEGKVPVVLLEDIMALKPPRGASLDGSTTSENEALESSHEGDSGLSRSSLSSRSSPEFVAEAKRNTSPLAASTPARKVGLPCFGVKAAVGQCLGSWDGGEEDEQDNEECGEGGVD